MRHPFDLSLSELNTIDLEFEESLTALEAEQVGGGFDVTTMALGEEGGEPITTQALGEEGGATSRCRGEAGGDKTCAHPKPRPRPPIRPRPPRPPIYTTMALGEEGGTSW